MISELLLAGIPDSIPIQEFVSRLELSWTMDAVSQVTIQLQDPGMVMFNKNYFQVRRELLYRDTLFEVASMEISQGPGSAAQITLEGRTAAIQRMKRDKTPQAYGGASPTEFASIVASTFGLKFIGQPTAAAKVIASATKDTEPESVWAVLTRLASDAKFSCFEAGGTLFFGSHEYLLQKWGNMTLKYPSDYLAPYTVLEIPSCRRSEDDIFSAEFQATLGPENAVDLRAGMTILLQGMNDFDWLYLLTEVSYEDGEGLPVSVAGRTPEKTI